MNKKIITIIITIITFITLAGASNAYAAGLSIRLEQPASPINDNDFKINFVTLDTQNQEVKVLCFKKGPNDTDFVQLGSDINLPVGGGSGECIVTSSVMNISGSYSFYTQASTISETVSSSTVTVDYQTGSPGTPSNYSKEKIGSCQYKINFRTAADNGKTKKVEIYMSQLTSFSADSGTKVGEVGIGSDQEGNFTKDTAPDCDKTFYFAIRAFDNAGNGSGVVGDGITTITTTTITTTVTASPQLGIGAIPVESSEVQRMGILSEETTAATSSGVLLDEEETMSAQTSQQQASQQQDGNIINFVGNLFNLKDLSVGLMTPLFAAYLFFGFRRYRRS